MRLGDLANRIPHLKIIGNKDTDIKYPRQNSKDVNEGDIFCAITGQNFDGNNFVDEAIRNGAASIMSSRNNLSIG